MLEKLQWLWNLTLATAPGGQSVTVGQLVSVLVLVLVGYFGSRFLVYLLGRRMGKANMRLTSCTSPSASSSSSSSSSSA